MHALGMLNSGHDKTPLVGGGVIPLFLRRFLGTGSFDLQELYHSSGGQVLGFFGWPVNIRRRWVQWLDSITRVLCAALAWVGAWLAGVGVVVAWVC